MMQKPLAVPNDYYVETIKLWQIGEAQTKTPTELRNEKLGATVVKNLESRRFEAMYVSTGKEAVKQILSTIPRESKKTIEAQYAP